MHVLIVDDHPLLHAILAAVARKAMHARRIHSVLSLEEALAYVRTSEPLDLALLDLGLPGCSGVESLVRFRSAFPAVPVLVVSGNFEEGIPEAALRIVAGGGTFVPARQR
jgi:DNA-binding NarL/FixJ family response regulator